MGPDVQIFLWGFRWWPYALAHGIDPLRSTLLWPPAGIQVLWTTTVPLLSLAVAPITLAFGVATSWNLLVVVAPATAAWGAWLLCVELTDRPSASIIGGLLFGFSSFEAAQQMAHLQLTACVCVPLSAYLVVRYAHGRLGARGLAVRAAGLTIVQFLIAPEVLVTTLVVVALAFVLGLLTQRRSSAVVRCAAGSTLVGVLGGLAVIAPLLAVMLIHPPAHSSASISYSADVVNLVVPTRIIAIDPGWLNRVSSHFPGNLAEQSAYLGVPLLAAIAAFAISRRREPRTWLLVTLLAVCVLCSLGPRLTIDGIPTVWLPWSLATHFPLLADIEPVRFSLYTCLLASVIMADWLAHADRRSIGAWALAALVIASILPTRAAAWRPTPTAITDPALERVLAGQRVLSLPFFNPKDRGLYAQAEAGMRFALIDNWMQLRPRGLDPDLKVPELAAPGLAELYGPSATRFEQQLRAGGITRLLVWGADRSLLRGLGLHPEQLGNVLVYRLSSSQERSTTSEAAALESPAHP